MQVIKLYFKLLKHAIPVIVLYIIIFVIFVTLNINGENSIHLNKKGLKVAVVNYNETNEITSHFINYLESYLEIHNYKDREMELEYGVFYGKIDGTIMIPYRFGEDLLSKKEVKIGISSNSSQFNEVFINNLVNHYFNYANKLLLEDNTITKDEFIKKLDAYLFVGRNDITTNKILIQDYTRYFNYASYIIFVCILYGVNLVLRDFKDANIKRRFLISPNDATKMEKQLFYGNFIYTNILILLFILLERIINNQLYFNDKMLVIYLHFILYSYSVLGLSYLISTLVRKKDKLASITHLLPLAVAFVSGVFISQNDLRDILKQIASFTPTFWFIKGNSVINMMESISLSNISMILEYMITSICFSGVFFGLTLVIMKYKNQNEYNI